MNKLFNDVSNGLKRDIYIRKNSFRLSVDQFKLFSKKYFKDFNSDQNFRFTVDKEDFETMILLLRLYYNFWIIINDFQIEIYQEFPKKFLIIKEVNFQNHPHIPRIFKLNEYMISAVNFYGTSNWEKGIPLMSEIDMNTGLNNYSCQINYEFIRAANFTL